jgi:hypothetical protein
MIFWFLNLSATVNVSGDDDLDSSADMSKSLDKKSFDKNISKVKNSTHHDKGKKVDRRMARAKRRKRAREKESVGEELLMYPSRHSASSILL